MTFFACRGRGSGVYITGPRQRLSVISGVLLLLGCSGSASPPAAGPTSVGANDSVAAKGALLADPHAAAGTSELVAVDSPRVTPGGVRYIAPAGWTSLVQGAVTLLTAQEGDSHVAIIESTAGEPDAAVAEAWASYRRVPPPPLKLAIESGGEGWEQLRRYSYELSPNEKRGLVVTAQRHAQAWVVVIQDVSDATLGKRGAQFSLIAQSLRPASYEHESFAEWSSDVASRANDDGTVSFVTISPGPVGFIFVVGSAGDKRTLTLREAQYEYVFVEAG